MLCTDCKYSVEQEFGHSNYDVTGVRLHCVLEKNTSFPLDEFDINEPSLQFAQECSEFVPGPNTYLVVEMEDDIEITGLLAKKGFAAI